MSTDAETRLAVALEKQAEAQLKLTAAVEEQTALTRLLWSAMKPAQRARLLGVSPSTERRRRKRQEHEALLRGKA